ncbi:hypothetical protein [Rhodanobacter sp. L36]|uniref:hypothetical protein n=1 Tax=Rhodanobacter sp. L36 TaxID=1747221 RepID=UPI00131C1583|nr:hypothetical protein [Rhodanobacter sp. L36]
MDTKKDRLSRFGIKIFFIVILISGGGLLLGGKYELDVLGFSFVFALTALIVGWIFFRKERE